MGLAGFGGGISHNLGGAAATLVGADPITQNNFDILRAQAKKRGLPTGMIEDLVKNGNVGWKIGNWLGYSPFWNNVKLPQRYYRVGNTLRNDLRPTELGDVYQELFHAYWDQILEERADCKWLKDAMIQAGVETWTGQPLGLQNANNLHEMVEEAVSETISSWILFKANAAQPTYENSAEPPGHNEVQGDKWYGNPYAAVTMNEELYDLVVHLLENGCERPPDQ